MTSDSPTPPPAPATPPPATPPPAPRVLPNPLKPVHDASPDIEFQNYESLEIVSTFGEPQAEYAALHKACGLMDCAHRGVLELTGKDRLPFLNNLLTNDVWSKATKSGLAAGEGRYALLLNGKGRIELDVNVIERGDRTFLETDARLVAPLLKTLDKYLFADQVKLFDRVGVVHELALHGPTAPAVLEAAVGSPIPQLLPLGSTDVTLFGVPVTVWRDDPCGAPGVHLLVPSDRVADVWTNLVRNFGELVAHAKRPLRPVGWAAFNTVRIEAGRPLYGIDFDASVLPAEVGPETFARAVSVTKGCYLGQEIVARMYARKMFARQLVGLRMADEALPFAGSGVFDDAGNAIGGVTSSTISPLFARRAVAFGFVKKPWAEDGKVVMVPAEGSMRPATVAVNLRSVERPSG